MYEPEPTFEDYDLAAYEAALENAEIIAAHSPRFWDADAAELLRQDPWEHPSWDVAEALAETGWDDPADAARVLERTVIADHRLLGLAETPTGRPRIRPATEALLEESFGEELLHERVLALVPIDADGTWPAEQIRAEVRAA
ncbi:hypothetical protein [Nocardiopsis sp. L17-MgMaSL7]|uniref:hypothetical protein n=1 Tax=Nocardiopsis sp. L17-MgMaSL7 TaxID=1938893 RepID=UPI000D715B06|nr:hypothetical protein [Nocardiopsis sp. L17-MgMaSL7]PWV44553.1 hypothetical protein BDW27_12312 [Nocardiopsis sp. L17-MgMaSL7]